MSREAAGDGKPDVAEEIKPAAMASGGAGAGEATVTEEAPEPHDPGRAPLPDDYDGIPLDDEESALAADDDIAGDPAAADPGDAGLGDAGVSDASLSDASLSEGGLSEGELGEEGEELPGTLLELAELVEIDEPGTVLAAPRRWPRLLLALGFVVLAAAIVAGAVAIVGSVTHGFKKPVKVTYTKSPVFSLKTGQCIDPQGQSYTVISCDLPHEAEVFATFSLTGTTWPGARAVAAAASSGCSTRLTGYLNPQLAVSLASTYVYPDATAWQAGTRTVICEVKAASGELTGSVRGASATAG
jgi:Septum formation